MDIPLTAGLTAAAFAFEDEVGLWELRDGLSSAEAFFRGAVPFALLMGSIQAYLWWSRLRRPTTDPGVAELPPEGIVLSQRQTVIRILKGIPLWLVGAAVAVLLTGPLGAGMVVGGTLGSAVSVLSWRAWERKTGLRAYTPSHPWTWRLGRKNPGPWLYYGPNVDRGS